MASWMIHLRVADALLSCFDGICETEFVVGNLAPDSGIPNTDWSEYTPSSVISHFKEPDESGHKRTNVDKYISLYFTKELQKGYTDKEYSFYLGYLTHLLTDVIWVEKAFPVCISKDPEEYKNDPKGIVWKWKKDFFDLDSLYLKVNPEFRAFAIYENAVGFENEYMDIFPPHAFELRRSYITAFYRTERNDLEREYSYYNRDDADRFVSEAVKIIHEYIVNNT